MQLVKYLQAQGVGSRRQCERLAECGGVEVNGETVSGAKTEIAPDSVRTLRIGGAAVCVVPLPYFYIVLNKPAGYETSHKPRDWPGVFTLFPANLRNLDMQAVGRLDADTTGVLLITNDGQFNHRMTSPKHHVANSTAPRSNTPPTRPCAKRCKTACCCTTTMKPWPPTRRSLPTRTRCC